MISVIVPVYNVERYLRGCLDSLLGQTYRELEVILVDDGATDSSGAICDEYARGDERIRVIHKENGGLSSARNAGLSVARGEYIAFVDSDDTVESDAYELMLSCMTGVDIVLCGTRVVREGERHKKRADTRRRTLSREELWEEIFVKLDNSVGNKLYRKSVLEGITFPEGLVHGEDLLFNLRVLQHARAGVFLFAKKYNYYKREGSITTGRHFTPRMLDEITTKDAVLRYVREHKPEYRERARAYSVLARMNVCRKLFFFGVEQEYGELVGEIVETVKREANSIKRLLRPGRRVELFLLLRARWLYRMFVKVVGA